MLKYGDNNARKKHLVVVITADVKRKKLMCVEAHIEGKEHTEASIAMEHLSILASSGMKIKKFYGDGAFDQSPLLDKLHSIGTKPIIKIRKNASIDYYNGSKFCRKIVREYKNLGYKR
ncbi:MAG: IS5/IS1182 family transposase, partial [Thermoplasmatales archaeon]